MEHLVIGLDMARLAGPREDLLVLRHDVCRLPGRSKADVRRREGLGVLGFETAGSRRRCVRSSVATEKANSKGGGAGGALTQDAPSR